MSTSITSSRTVHPPATPRPVVDPHAQLHSSIHGTTCLDCRIVSSKRFTYNSHANAILSKHATRPASAAYGLIQHLLDMHICIPCVNRRGPHNWHSSNPAAVILLVCGRCTDPASSQWLVYGTARPITRVWPLQSQRPYPAYPDLSATNKPHRVSQQGESATNKRDT